MRLPAPAGQDAGVVCRADLLPPEVRERPQGGFVCRPAAWAARSNQPHVDGVGVSAEPVRAGEYTTVKVARRLPCPSVCLRRKKSVATRRDLCLRSVI